MYYLFIIKCIDLQSIVLILLNCNIYADFFMKQYDFFFQHY